MLVNTSFNVHEEPIVNRPEECLKALTEGRVDFVVTKNAVYRPAVTRQTECSNRVQPQLTGELA